HEALARHDRSELLPRAHVFTPKSKPAVDRGLQPRLVGGGALFPARDLVGVLEGEPDVVEAFEQTHAVGGRDIEADIAAAGTGDALGSKIDGERRRAVDR